MKEIWVKIDGFNYQISSFGNVKNIKTNQILKQRKTKRGYIQLILYKNTIPIPLLIHRVVAKHFIPNNENKPEINHINGIKTDNRVENLEWCTRSENCLHARKIGLTPLAGNKNYKYDSITIKEIREEYQKGLFRQKDLVSKYKISKAHLSQIINKNSRKELL